MSVCTFYGFFFFVEKPDYEQPGTLFIKLNETSNNTEGAISSGQPHTMFNWPFLLEH